MINSEDFSVDKESGVAEKAAALTRMGCWLRITLAALLVISTTRSGVDATKLNYPRVLLPIFDHISVNFTLEVVEKGCFKWCVSCRTWLPCMAATGKPVTG